MSWSGGAIDLVARERLSQKPAWATEIKWSNRFYEKLSDLKALRKFCHGQGLRQAVCTTENRRGIKLSAGIELNFVTNAEYAYTVGRRGGTEDQGVG